MSKTGLSLSNLLAGYQSERCCHRHRRTRGGDCNGIIVGVVVVVAMAIRYIYVLRERAG